MFFVYLFVCPPFLLSSSPNVWSMLGSVNLSSAPGGESRVPRALLSLDGAAVARLSKRTTEKLHRC